MEKSLRSSEWVILSSFLLVFFSLIIFTRIKIYKISACLSVEVFQNHEPVVVTIEGAVSKPGSYSVLPGTLLGKIIKKSRPKKNADLSLIDLEQRIEEPVELFIKEKEKIIVWLVDEEGSREALELPLGAHFSDIKSKINPCLQIDPQLFKKRRSLHDGEEILVGHLP